MEQSVNSYSLFSIGDPGAGFEVAGVLVDGRSQDMEELLNIVSTRFGTGVSNASTSNMCRYYLDYVDYRSNVPHLGLSGDIMEVLEREYGFTELDHRRYAVFALIDEAGSLAYRLFVGHEISVRSCIEEFLSKQVAPGSLVLEGNVYYISDLQAGDIEVRFFDWLRCNGLSGVDYCQVHSFL